MRPLVALTTGTHVDPHGRRQIVLFDFYCHALRTAGAVPVAVPPVADRAEADAILARLDGLLLIGGDDIDPARYGQAPHPKTGRLAPERERSDFALLAAADAARRPVFGICLGCQELNVARGGTLHQHVPDLPGVAETHSGPFPDRATHAVRIEPATRLADILGAGELRVNSAHHQAVDRVGAGLRPAAFAAGGLVEALEGTDPGRFVLAVQWHPEELAARRPDMQRLFDRFVAECGRASQGSHRT